MRILVRRTGKPVSEIMADAMMTNGHLDTEKFFQMMVLMSKFQPRDAGLADGLNALAEGSAEERALVEEVRKRIRDSQKQRVNGRDSGDDEGAGEARLALPSRPGAAT